MAEARAATPPRVAADAMPRRRPSLLGLSISAILFAAALFSLAHMLMKPRISHTVFMPMMILSATPPSYYAAPYAEAAATYCCAMRPLGCGAAGDDAHFYRHAQRHALPFHAPFDDGRQLYMMPRRQTATTRCSPRRRELFQARCHSSLRPAPGAVPLMNAVAITICIFLSRSRRHGYKIKIFHTISFSRKSLFASGACQGESGARPSSPMMDVDYFAARGTYVTNRKIFAGRHFDGDEQEAAARDDFRMATLLRCGRARQQSREWHVNGRCDATLIRQNAPTPRWLAMLLDDIYAATKAAASHWTIPRHWTMDI